MAASLSLLTVASCASRAVMSDIGSRAGSAAFSSSGEQSFTDKPYDASSSSACHPVWVAAACTSTEAESGAAPRAGDAEPACALLAGCMLATALCCVSEPPTAVPARALRLGLPRVLTSRCREPAELGDGVMMVTAGCRLRGCGALVPGRAACTRTGLLGGSSEAGALLLGSPSRADCAPAASDRGAVLCCSQCRSKARS